MYTKSSHILLSDNIKIHLELLYMTVNLILENHRKHPNKSCNKEKI